MQSSDKWHKYSFIKDNRDNNQNNYAKLTKTFRNLEVGTGKYSRSNWWNSKCKSFFSNPNKAENKHQETMRKVVALI